MLWRPRYHVLSLFASPLGQAKEKLGKDLEQAAARYTKSPEILLKAFVGAGKGDWMTDDASSPFFEWKDICSEERY